jgi:hypothetical protein
MNPQDQERAFDDLLDRLSIDALTDGEWQQLAAMIASDEAVLRRYIEAVHWQQSMGHLVGGPPPQRAMTQPEGDLNVETTVVSPSTPMPGATRRHCLAST